MTFTHLARRALVLAALTMLLAACDPLLYLPGTARPWFCDPVDVALNDSHGSGESVYTQPKGPLSAADCKLLDEQLAGAKTSVSGLGTVAEAKSAGWIQAAVWSPGQGIHFVDPSRQTGPFDPSRPNWLMYDGDGPTAKLTGMMFLVDSGMTPPAGFPGDNDHWHQHHELCTDIDAIPFIVGEELSDAQCAALGGVNVMYMNLWMVHVWLPTYAGWLATDIFNRTHPLVP